MARVAYTDLLVKSALGANTNPNTTNVPLLITNLYRQAFRARNTTYTTDTDAVIDSEDVWGIILAEASRIVNQWQEAVAVNSESKMPEMILSKGAIEQIKGMTAETLHLIENVRMWNESDADY